MEYLFCWIEAEVEREPSRCLILLALDLNNQLRLGERVARVDAAHVGPSAPGSENAAGARFRRWLQHQHLYAVTPSRTWVTSTWPSAPFAGRLHRGAVGFVKAGTTLLAGFSDGLSFQVVPDVRVRDHVPTHREFAGDQFHPPWSGGQGSDPVRWDRDKIARALADPCERQRFVDKVQLRLAEGDITRLSADDLPDCAYALLLRGVMQAAVSRFGSGRREYEGQRRLAAQRRDLLAERARLRERLEGPGACERLFDIACHLHAGRREAQRRERAAKRERVATWTDELREA